MSGFEPDLAAFPRTAKHGSLWRAIPAYPALRRETVTRPVRAAVITVGTPSGCPFTSQSRRFLPSLLLRRASEFSACPHHAASRIASIVPDNHTSRVRLPSEIKTCLFTERKIIQQTNSPNSIAPDSRGEETPPRKRRTLPPPDLTRREGKNAVSKFLKSRKTKTRCDDRVF
jgi:hypothetical protein